MMYQSVNLQEYYLYHQKCKILLEEPKIRFAGFLDFMGNLIAGGFKEGVTPLHDESERRKLHIETVLRARTEQDFDYDLGQVEYSVSRRKRVITYTFVLGDKVLFVSSEPTVNIEETAQKIIKIIYI